MGHIQMDHYANLHFDGDEARFIRIIEWFWGTYGALFQRNMVGPFRKDPKVFRRVVQYYGTERAMEYFQAREVEVRERD